MVKNGELITPPLADGPLPGITRAVVLVLAAEVKMPVSEKSFGPEFLPDAAEVFATNSRMEIAPVLSWGQPGPVTHRLQIAYRKFVLDELQQ